MNRKLYASLLEAFFADRRAGRSLDWARTSPHAHIRLAVARHDRKAGRPTVWTLTDPCEYVRRVTDRKPEGCEQQALDLIAEAKS